MSNIRDCLDSMSLQLFQITRDVKNSLQRKAFIYSRHRHILSLIALTGDTDTSFHLLIQKMSVRANSVDVCKWELHMCTLSKVKIVNIRIR